MSADLLGQARARTSAILEAETPLGMWIGRFLGVLIVCNLAALILETVDSVYAAAGAYFRLFEAVSVAIFATEYLLRVWAARELRRYRRPVTGRIRYVLSPMALADLAAIAPFFLPMLGLDLRSTRVLRLFRLLRLAKLGRYSLTMRVFGRVLAAKRMELAAVLGFLALLLVLSASLIYFAEHEAQPDVFSSIPAAMWWGVATLTTVGYGDTYPITALGRVFGSIIAVLGIGMFALPTGILGAAFVEELAREREGPTRCPHCHEQVQATDLEPADPGSS